jgi:hypothetical protein
LIARRPILFARAASKIDGRPIEPGMTNSGADPTRLTFASWHDGLLSEMVNFPHFGTSALS